MAENKRKGSDIMGGYAVPRKRRLSFQPTYLKWRDDFKREMKNLDSDAKWAEEFPEDYPQFNIFDVRYRLVCELADRLPADKMIQDYCVTLPNSDLRHLAEKIKYLSWWASKKFLNQTFRASWILRQVFKHKDTLWSRKSRNFLFICCDGYVQGFFMLNSRIEAIFDKDDEKHFIENLKEDEIREADTGKIMLGFFICVQPIKMDGFQGYRKFNKPFNILSSIEMGDKIRNWFDNKRVNTKTGQWEVLK